MIYSVSVNVGQVRRGFFFSLEPEFNTSILPYAAISCFSQSSCYKVSRSSFSCEAVTDLSAVQAAKAFADKICELAADFTLEVSVTETEAGASAKIGEKSAVSVRRLDGDSFEIESPTPTPKTDENEQDGRQDADVTGGAPSFNLSDLKDLSENNRKNMIGWEDFKSYFEDVANIAPQLHERNTIEAFKAQCYLISINDGCGLTRAVNDLTLLGNYLGAYDSDYYYEYVLGNETLGRRIAIKDVIPNFKNSENRGRLICLDISEFTGKEAQYDLKNLLREVSQHVTKMSYVFRVPYLEPSELKRIEAFISDILLLKTFVIPPYSDNQLLQFADKFLGKYNFSMDEEATSLFFAKIREEKSDGSFYGIRTVKKVVDQFVLAKHQKNAERTKASAEGNRPNDSAEEGILRKEDVQSLVKAEAEASLDPYEELAQMVGMERIAERIKEIVSQVKTAINNDSLEKPCMHMRFVGAPGTGKTTVARIVGRIFAQNGILTNGYFFEYAGRDLCGRYVGQTAPKTLSICREAYGSVLFLDEAYELYTSDRNESDYGHEALATLIAEMENHRENFVVIMAGYTASMETLMKGNAGLRSRMPFVVEFPSYNRGQLVAIYMRMLESHFECVDGIEERVRAFFDTLPDEYLASEEFANARYVRNLYERTWSKAAMRSQMEGRTDVCVTKSDFELASQEAEFKERIASVRNRVGF